MGNDLTITVTPDVERELDTAAREDGVSRDEYANRALKQYLVLKRFRTLRDRLLAESDREFTDEEIFALVS